MAKASKKSKPSKEPQPWNPSQGRSGVLQRLQVEADTTRYAASVTGDPWLASLVRIIDGLAAYGLYVPQDSSDIQKLETEVAGVLFKHGTPKDKTRTMQMRRGKKLGSPRAVWAHDLSSWLELEIRSKSMTTARQVAGTIAMSLFHDWPGETGPMTADSVDAMTATIEAVLPTDVKTTDVEAMIVKALKAVGVPDNEARFLFSFAEKRYQRI